MRWCVLTVGLALVGTATAEPPRPRTLADQAAPRPVGLADLPDGFAEEVVATGFTGAVGLAVAADGRVFVCEQTGALRVVKEGRLLTDPFVTVPVDSSWERGLIGVALDPSFPEKPYVYLCYVALAPYPHHVVSRFTAAGDRATHGSELVLLRGDDQTTLGGNVPNGDQGGGLQFGPDGKLYVGLGEQTAGLPAQRLDTLQGKLLRLNPDGSVPADNPFTRSAAGKYRSIWALGLRNPFALAFQPGTGRLFVNDVGQARWEEVNEGVAGANYGWPHAEGPTAAPRFRGPVHAYDRGRGRSIAGGAFLGPDPKQFPRNYVGKYFLADYMDNWVRILDPDRPGASEPFAAGLAGPVALAFGPDGGLLYLNRNVWVKDGQFRPNTGSLHRISYVANSGRPAPVLTAHPVDQTAAPGRAVTLAVRATGGDPLRYQWRRGDQPVPGADGPTLTVTVTPADDGAEFRCVVSNAYGVVKSRPASLWTAPLPALPAGVRVGPDPAALPKLLSETGVFRSLADLTPAAGVRPYAVNSPLWSDGADKRRWLVLPVNTQIGFAERGEWTFPPGTAFVKHFELAGRRLETRLLVTDRRGSGYGVTYKWRSDGSDAELLADGLTEEVEAGGRRQAWQYPSRTECLACHTPNAGFVLGANTRQLNRPGADNPLVAWSRLGLFRPAVREEDVPRLDRLAAVTDSTASLAHRARSYLDANCAHCHRPGGTRADFDARFDAPGYDFGAVKLASGDLGVAGAKLVAPGDSGRSMLYLRAARRDGAVAMPPLATTLVDEDAAAVLAAWIRSLPTGAK